jgi:hypothetical protein
MPQIGSSLPGLLTENQDIAVDQTESVDHNFPLDTLNRINYDRDGTLGQGFETLLSVHIDAGQPTTEARMRMVPAYDHFRSTALPEHVQHFRLENWVHSFHAYALKIGKKFSLVWLVKMNLAGD